MTISHPILASSRILGETKNPEENFFFFFFFSQWEKFMLKKKKKEKKKERERERFGFSSVHHGNTAFGPTSFSLVPNTYPY